MLQLRLGRDSARDPAKDPLGRSHVGYRPGMSEQEAWTAGRGTWVLKADRALAQDEVQIVNLDGIVVAVAKIRGITRTREPGRYAIDGELLLGDPRVGKPTTTPHRSQNSVAYF
jgi:hypothetical protein